MMEVAKAFSKAAFSKSVVVVITVLMAVILGAGALVSSGQVKDARAADAVELTYTKWFSPRFPTMTGVVGGDIAGSFGGTVLDRDLLADGQIGKLTAIYEVIAADPSRSFTALVQGTQNNETHTAVLNGVVTSGWLTGEQVHAEYTVISCTQAANHVCFQGTIRVG
jgi:hypothetical protein